MDQADVDCASCGYVIKDFSTVVSVPCGHGVIHYNCSYLWDFNKIWAPATCRKRLIDFLVTFVFTAITNARFAIQSWQQTKRWCSFVQALSVARKAWNFSSLKLFDRWMSWRHCCTSRSRNSWKRRMLSSKFWSWRVTRAVWTECICRELNEQLKSKDEMILKLQKEVYEMKLEKVEKLKKELQDKLGSLVD